MSFRCVGVLNRPTILTTITCGGTRPLPNVRYDSDRSKTLNMWYVLVCMTTFPTSLIQYVPGWNLMAHLMLFRWAGCVLNRPPILTTSPCGRRPLPKVRCDSDTRKTLNMWYVLVEWRLSYLTYSAFSDWNSRGRLMSFRCVGVLNRPPILTAIPFRKRPLPKVRYDSDTTKKVGILVCLDRNA